MSTALLEPVRLRPTLSPVRRFKHPGLPAFPRLVSAEARHATELHVRVAEGSNVGTVLRQLLEQRAVRSGCGRILSGSTTHLQYHVIIPATAGDKPFIYGSPIVVDTPADLLASTLTLGRSADGVALLHCHGAFTSHGESRGGHFALDQTIAGPGGLSIELTLFDGVESMVTGDAETNYSILSPRLI